MREIYREKEIVSNRKIMKKVSTNYLEKGVKQTPICKQ